jgi:hypothetical protein
MGIGPPAGQNPPQRLRKAHRCLHLENDACGNGDGASFRAGPVAADPTPSKRLTRLPGLRSNTHWPLPEANLRFPEIRIAEYAARGNVGNPPGEQACRILGLTDGDLRGRTLRLGLTWERVDGTTIERAAGMWPVLTAWGFFIAEVWEAKHGAKNWIGVTSLISLVDQQE